MSLEVSTMRSSLTTFSSLLNLDPDIQTSVDKMVSKGRECLNSYESTITKEGGAILVQKELILAAKSAGDVNVQRMQSALDGITVKMRAVRDASLALQTDVHSNIESCRGRKQTHETTIATDQLTLNAIRVEIQGINTKIATFEADIVSMDNDAGTLENRAGDIDRARRRKKERGFWGAVTTIAGIGLAPFTGGLSLGLAAVGGVYAGKNFEDADSCRQAARDLRAIAQTRRSDAQRLREQNAAAAGRTSALELEIQGLQSKKAQLESTILALQQMTFGLTNLVKYIDIALNVFQTMDTTFKDVSLHSDSFPIIQNALKRHPDRFADRAQTMLEELQGKWSNMEVVLVANGARAILT